MTNTPLDELGPVDYLVVEFPAGASNFTGEMAKELLALVASGTIRVIDMLILTKADDGSVDATELSDVDDLGPLQQLETELADGTGQHRRGTDLGEPVGRTVRRRGAALRGPADRQRPDPDPGDRRLHPGRRGRHDRRSLRCRYVLLAPPGAG